MKLLLDQGTPRSAAAILRSLGIDSVHTGEVGLAGAEDVLIISQAALEHRVIVTLDADFHMHLALTQARQPSVVRIRIQGLRSEEFCDLVQSVLSQCSDDLDAGAVISVSDLQVRVRRLPLS